MQCINPASTDSLKRTEVARRRYISIEGDKNSYLPRGTHLDKQNPAVRSWLLIWQRNEVSDKTNNISRTLPSLGFAVNSSTARPRARQLTAKGDLSVNLCKRYVFRGWYRRLQDFHWRPFPTKIKHAKYFCEMYVDLYQFWSVKSVKSLPLWL